MSAPPDPAQDDTGSSEDNADDTERDPAGSDGAPEGDQGDETAVPPADPAVPEPTPDELAALPVMERAQLLFQERQFKAEERERRHARRHRRVNTLAIVLGIIVGVGTVASTGLTLRATEDQIRIAHEAQVADRYTRSIEALSSEDPTIRLGAMHALGHLMDDSPRDRKAITEILIAYINERGPKELGRDLEAAITVLAYRRDPEPLTHLDLADFNLFKIRLPKSNLNDAYLPGARMDGADLRDVDLRDANLYDTYMPSANLSGVDLRNAYLHSTNLGSADLHGANLSGANLHLARLSHANLRDANLRDASMRLVDLTPKDLRAVLRDRLWNLRDADLRGADLRGTGLSKEGLQGVAKVDERTLFGP